jgi:hypothetical protein
MRSIHRSVAQRFWSHVDVRGPSDCWLWQGAKDSSGYGSIWIAGKSMPTHRWAYEDKYGSIPPGLFILHTCDVRNCVNPAHLRPGTFADNMRDRDAKGRQAKGSAVGAAKLNDWCIREMRRWYATKRYTAQRPAKRQHCSHR